MALEKRVIPLRINPVIASDKHCSKNPKAQPCQPGVTVHFGHSVVAARLSVALDGSIQIAFAAFFVYVN